MSALVEWLRRHAVLLILLVLVISLGTALLVELDSDAQRAAKPADASDWRTIRRAAKPATKAPEVNRPAWAAAAAAAAKRVYAGADFNQKDSELTLIPRHPKEDKNPELPGWLRFFARIFSPSLARALSWVLWIAMAVGAAVALYYAVRWFQGWRGREIAARDPEQHARRIALGLHELPDDIPGAAERAWQDGDFVKALSLLYRGALRFLVDDRALKLPAGLTEGECLRAVTTQMQAPVAGGFTAVTRAWSAAAYAGRRPDSLDSLLITFAQHFQHREAAP